MIKIDIKSDSWNEDKPHKKWYLKNSVAQKESKEILCDIFLIFAV